MTLHRPFREVKLQWLQQLSCDKDLSDVEALSLKTVVGGRSGYSL